MIFFTDTCTGKIKVDRKGNERKQWRNREKQKELW